MHHQDYTFRSSRVQVNGWQDEVVGRQLLIPPLASNRATDFSYFREFSEPFADPRENEENLLKLLFA